MPSVLRSRKGKLLVSLLVTTGALGYWVSCVLRSPDSSAPEGSLPSSSEGGTPSDLTAYQKGWDDAFVAFEKMLDECAQKLMCKVQTWRDAKTCWGLRRALQVVHTEAVAKAGEGT